MVECICPHCERRQGLLDRHAGREGVCLTCGRVFWLPDLPTQDGAREAGAPPPTGRPLTEAELEAYLDRRAGLPGSSSFLLGVLVPLVLVGFAAWFGFVEQDIHVGGSLRSGPGWFARGPAAIWGGIAGIAAAVTIHAAFFWGPKPRCRLHAVWAAVVGLLLFLAATLLAAVL